MPVTMTETAIRAATARAAERGIRVEIADERQEGLRLRITSKGARTWVLACRDPLERMRRFTLGRYPTMGISDAREAARNMRVEVRKGADPTADAQKKRAMAREAKEGIGTLRALLDLYGAKRGAALKSWPECCETACKSFQIPGVNSVQ